MEESKAIEDFLVELMGTLAPDEAFETDESVGKWYKTLDRVKTYGNFDACFKNLCRKALVALDSFLCTYLYNNRDCEVDCSVYAFVELFGELRASIRQMTSCNPLEEWLDSFISKLERFDSKLYIIRKEHSEI